MFERTVPLWMQNKVRNGLRRMGGAGKTGQRKKKKKRREKAEAQKNGFVTKLYIIPTENVAELPM